MVLSRMGALLLFKANSSIALTAYLVRVESLTPNLLYSYFISSVLYQLYDFCQEKSEKNEQKILIFFKNRVFSPIKQRRIG